MRQRLLQLLPLSDHFMLHTLRRQNKAKLVRFSVSVAWKFIHVLRALLSLGPAPTFFDVSAFVFSNSAICIVAHTHTHTYGMSFRALALLCSSHPPPLFFFLTLSNATTSFLCLLFLLLLLFGNNDVKSSIPSLNF